ncbi:hypothetical protein Zmor_007581 [Zophobas morio]|uniref:Uncharacterized protein n=1 Tax=Zophobas morio TaxID=2755281 RepID=A0AA38MPY1_9CUCU|nr:hypothetical protein Zmor_007581 [Zophobas morio]
MLFEKCKVMLSVQWYHCDLSKLPPDLSSKFVELGPDDDTIKFLQQSEEKSDWVLTQIWHSIVKVFLGWFMTQTSINGTRKREKERRHLAEGGKKRKENTSTPNCHKVNYVWAFLSECSSNACFTRREANGVCSGDSKRSAC